MRSRPAMIGPAMRYQNAIPEVQCLKIPQSRIALRPSSGVDVVLQTRKLRINIADLRERGNSLSNHRIQVSMWPLPIRAQKTIATICGNGDCNRFDRPNCLLKTRHGWKYVSIGAEQFRKVVKKPEFRADIEIVRQEHDLELRDPRALCEALRLIPPVMHRQDAEDGVKAAIPERNRFRAPLNHRSRAHGTL